MGYGSGVAVSGGVGCRRGLDLALLWLWYRPAAVALIRLLAWEPPYAAGMALKEKRKKIVGNWEFSLWLSGLQTQLVSMKMRVQSLASLSGLRIQNCCKLQLKFGIAMPVV